MAYKMDAKGNWIYVNDNKSKSDPDGKSSSKKVDKTNTSDTDSAIKETALSKTENIKFAEEASFSCNGDHQIRKGGHLKVRYGVANRWKGSWLIIETTHTIDSSGYKVEGRLGRLQYREKDDSGLDGSKLADSLTPKNNIPTVKKDKTADATKEDNSAVVWKMDASGKWVKT